MSPLELEWVKFGLLGLVVVTQQIAIRAMFKALQDANEARDHARAESLLTLERVLSKLDSKSSRNDS